MAPAAGVTSSPLLLYLPCVFSGCRLVYQVPPVPGTASSVDVTVVSGSRTVEFSYPVSHHDRCVLGAPKVASLVKNSG